MRLALNSTLVRPRHGRRIVEATGGHKNGPLEDAKSTPERFGRREVESEAMDLM